jgi:hypothetical protein
MFFRNLVKHWYETKTAKGFAEGWKVSSGGMEASSSGALGD